MFFIACVWGFGFSMYINRNQKQEKMWNAAQQISQFSLFFFAYFQLLCHNISFDSISFWIIEKVQWTQQQQKRKKIDTHNFSCRFRWHRHICVLIVNFLDFSCTVSSKMENANLACSAILIHSFTKCVAIEFH